MQRFFAVFAFLLFMVGCGRSMSQSHIRAPASLASARGEPEIANSRTVFCPSGTTYSSTYRLCVTSTEAVGPFTQVMISRCKDYGGGPACESGRWALSMAQGVRGTGTCMPGSKVDSVYDECVEGDAAYGPFSKASVDYCKQHNGGKACESMRISKNLLPRQNGVKLSVPYFWQLANQYEPSRTCNITSLAMVFQYFGLKKTPEDIYLYAGGPVYTGSGLAEIARNFGLTAVYSERGSKSSIQQSLRSGKPVILQNWFTRSGHMIVLIGYDSTGWIANDPYGKWSQVFMGGFSEVSSTAGKGVHYPYDAVEKAATDAGDPSSYWVTTFSR